MQYEDLGHVGRWRLHRRIGLAWAEKIVKIRGYRTETEGPSRLRSSPVALDRGAYVRLARQLIAMLADN
jgi:hypothetical protein